MTLHQAVRSHAVAPRGKRCWRPLFTGDHADLIRAAVTDIGDALQSDRPLTDGPVTQYTMSSPGVGGGDAGIAIFFAYLARSFPGCGYDERALHLIDRAARAMSEYPMPSGLYGGFAGIAWAAVHAGRQSPMLDPGDDATDEIDDALLALVRTTPWRDDYDLISGIAGIGVYALERLPRATAVMTLETIAERLDELAERTSEGTTWLTRPEHILGPSAGQFPLGWYNLGVAHGVPGIIGLLAEMCAAGLGGTRARLLLDGAVRWVLANRLPEGSESSFPTMRAPGEDPKSCRAAWCYGDPGIAATLLLASRGAHRADWEHEALTIARHAASRAFDRTGVNDASLCHGAAGLAQLYNRMYQATGDERLGFAARRWITLTMEARQPGRGVAGFEYWTLESGGYQPVRGFLEGAAGIGLALLASIEPIEPMWDRLLLSAIPMGED